jgi:UDP:flavonoid glycosyltransferase YjiC (YdhE family)
MGVARSIPRERYNAEVAAREIQNLLENKTYAERAAAIGAQVRNEKGTARACDLLGRLLEDPNAEVTNPQLVSQVVA